MRDLTIRRGHVLVVGVGDDGPAGLAPAVLAGLRQADLLVGGRRHLALFDEIVAERWVIERNVAALIGRIEREAARRRVAVLASGDPCFFGIGPLLVERLGRARVEIVPGVSAVALAFARLGVAWQDARVVSAHGRPLAEAVAAARGAHKLAVLTDDESTPAVVAEALLAAGAEDADAWVFEHLGGDREAETRATLSGLRGRGFAALNVLVVPRLGWRPEAAPCPGAADPAAAQARGAASAPSRLDTPLSTQATACPALAFGLPESEYVHKAGLITKPEARAISLSKLRLPPGGVLWDVGAGSGSLAIEAARLARGLTVYAVERAPEQLSMLRLNVERHGVDGAVRVVAGEAPSALVELPPPDAVFVGGSGGRLAEILDAAAARLRTGGRIVLNLVTLERIAATLAWARAHSIEPELVQVSVARGADVQGLTRLQAENPVTVVTLAP